MTGRCIWLDGGAAKACRILRARLNPLGWRVWCLVDMWDGMLVEMAVRAGCALVTTDKRMSCRGGCIRLDHDYVARKSARDLATMILKNLRRAR